VAPFAKQHRFRLKFEKNQENLIVKKETTILVVIIAFVVGLVVGASSGILYMVNRAGSDRPAVAQKGPVVPQAAPGAPQKGPVSPEVTSKIDALKQIVKKDPRNVAAWAELGNLYFDSEQPREAIAAYQQYLAVKPDSADVRTDLGIMYRSTGDYDRAIEEFRKACQIDQKHVNSRYNLGIVLLHDKQDLKGAIQAWEEYLKVDPKSERAIRVKAQMDKMKKMVKS
jgi:cytochrome c-type biogenesis protein CcmH/NrfG